MMPDLLNCLAAGRYRSATLDLQQLQYHPSSPQAQRSPTTRKLIHRGNAHGRHAGVAGVGISDGLLVLAARSATLPGAAQGLAYYLNPDLSRLLDVSLYGSALGQAFFSLSLGMGAMLTYGSYLGKNQGIASSALWVVLLDTSIALLAGFIIFPAGFSIEGFDPSASGPGLIFAVLPRLFATLPGGQLFGAAFFVLLTMAALTSTISLLEVPVSHFVDTLSWSRRKAVVVVTTGVFCLAIPSGLASGAVPFFTTLPGLGSDFLTVMEVVWQNFALPIGGLLTAVFIGWVWRTDEPTTAPATPPHIPPNDEP